MKQNLVSDFLQRRKLDDSQLVFTRFCGSSFVTCSISLYVCVGGAGEFLLPGNIAASSY